MLKCWVTCKGAALEHQLLQHPFYDRQVPVILGEHVTTEAGTGAVHTAPGHGEDDFRVGKPYDLPVTSPVGADGLFLARYRIVCRQVRLERQRCRFLSC